MAFSRLSCCFYLLTYALLLHSVLGVDPLLHYCTSNENFTANGPYETGLKMLKRFFYLQAPAGGFALGTLGADQDRPYGLALCRGDVSPLDCRICVVNASREVQKRCPLKKGGVIWYDNCLLKYSNEELFGQIDSQNKFSLLNVKNVSDPVTFNQNVKQLLGQLAHQASSSAKTMYAAGDLQLTGSTKLYGLAQCTRDLSSVDCGACLDALISELPSCCDGKEGGRVRLILADRYSHKRRMLFILAHFSCDLIFVSVLNKTKKCCVM